MNLKLPLQTILLLTTSALCYGIAFTMPYFFWWLLFFYPIFILLLPEKIGFFTGFFWSFIAHGIHLVGIAVALYQMNTSLWIITGMYLYVTITNGLVFACVKKISSSLNDRKQNITIAPILNNATAMIMSHYWMTKAILAPFGRIEGYIFMHPIILLIGTPLQAAIKLYNIEIFTIIFYCLTFFVTLFIHTKQNKYLFISLFCFFLLVIPMIFKTNKASITPPWINKIAVLPLFFPNPTNLTAISDMIKEKIASTLQKNPELELFILPEGAINCPLSCEQIEKIFAKKTTYSMIICSQCFKKQKLRNSCFFVTNNTCKTIYHKRHALPITEQPAWYQTTDMHIAPSKNKRPLFSIDQNVSFVPYICSDFFFFDKQDDNFQDIPIIVLCNDIWFSDRFASSVQQLMLKTAQLKAMTWHRPIMYVAYSASYAIDTNGNLIPLAQIQ